jgi:hypothetical protein
MNQGRVARGGAGATLGSTRLWALLGGFALALARSELGRRGGSVCAGCVCYLYIPPSILVRDISPAHISLLYPTYSTLSTRTTAASRLCWHTDGTAIATRLVDPRSTSDQRVPPSTRPINPPLQSPICTDTRGCSA